MLQGKVAVITGATSGIGAATARRLVAAGAQVALLGRSDERGKALESELGTGKAAFIRCDVTDQASCKAAIDAVVARFGRIDVLVNGAGVFFYGTVTQATDREWRNTMSTNVDGVFYMSRIVVPLMIKGGGGTIVNIASDWGLVGGTRALAYCASKGAVVQITRCMALDHVRQGIRVNAVCPGETNTPMLIGEYAEKGMTPEEGFADSATATPIGRVAQPEEVAEAIFFLASDASSYINGVALPLDGGNTAA
jgi:NAD(P)-dependent dehydrogenase (short-subunit alcohol dehydrogenase family)